MDLQWILGGEAKGISSVLWCGAGEMCDTQGRSSRPVNLIFPGRCLDNAPHSEHHIQSKLDLYAYSVHGYLFARSIFQMTKLIYLLTWIAE